MKFTCNICFSDIVREMREAAKVREESLISKVKSMMNEKLPNPIADTSQTELDKLKVRISKLLIFFS